MSELMARFQEDIKVAMRSNDTTRRDVLRFLRADVHNVEIERGHALSDDEVLEVIRRQIKQRRDSIEQFERGGRNDLVEQEQAQIVVLEEYLPPQMPYDQVLGLARLVVSEVNATGPRDMGKVMPVLRERVGSQAEGSVVANAAKEALASVGEAQG